MTTFHRGQAETWGPSGGESLESIELPRSDFGEVVTYLLYGGYGSRSERGIQVAVSWPLRSLPSEVRRDSPVGMVPSSKDVTRLPAPSRITTFIRGAQVRAGQQARERQHNSPTRNLGA